MACIITPGAGTGLRLSRRPVNRPSPKRSRRVRLVGFHGALATLLIRTELVGGVWLISLPSHSSHHGCRDRRQVDSPNPRSRLSSRCDPSRFGDCMSGLASQSIGHPLRRAPHLIRSSFPRGKLHKSGMTLVFSRCSLKGPESSGNPTSLESASVKAWSSSIPVPAWKLLTAWPSLQKRIVELPNEKPVTILPVADTRSRLA
jgi:hypothetical protein